MAKSDDKRFFIPTEELVKAIGAVYRAASTDETRPHLNAVHVAREGAALRFVATNGHWMAVYTTSLPTVGTTTPDNGGEWDATLSLESAVSLMKRAAKKLGQAEIDLDGKKASARFVDEERIPLAIVDCQYPPWRDVFPKEGNKTSRATIGVNFQYMADIYQSFVAVIGKPKKRSFGRSGWAGELCIEPGKDLGPMRITCLEAGALEVVLMPARQGRQVRLYD